MEKVKVTREQAKAIEKIKDIDYAINIHSFKKRPDSPLVDMSTARLARALFVGYEVEPEFLVGDTVIHKETGVIEEVDGYMTTILEKHSDKYRHATPSEIAEEKERRWWAKHGRDVWELRQGDVIYDEDENLVVIVHTYLDKSTDDEKVVFRSGGWEFTDNIPEQFKVVCFVENRLDVKTNE